MSKEIIEKLDAIEAAQAEKIQAVEKGVELEYIKKIEQLK